MESKVSKQAGRQGVMERKRKRNLSNSVKRAKDDLIEMSVAADVFACLERSVQCGVDRAGGGGDGGGVGGVGGRALNAEDEERPCTEESVGGKAESFAEIAQPLTGHVVDLRVQYVQCRGR